MATKMDRREMLKVGTAALALGPAAFGQTDPSPAKTVRVGVIGTGNRGSWLTKTLAGLPHVEIPALCDMVPDKLKAAEQAVVAKGGKKPELYTGNETAYKKLLAREDLDAVVIASFWEWHTPMAVEAMKAGKYAAVEVPAALSLEECWQLVRTHEETGVPCMMLENWSFRQDNLAVLNMIRQGMFGRIVHCHCAHSHDCIDHWFFDREGNDRWPAKYLINHNRDQYPTHSVGPVLSWMDINCGDAFDTITSTASGSWGINAYFARKFGPDHPSAKRTYAQGDIVTSVVKTKQGKTLVINYDMQLPRPYDNRWLIQGTLGVYNEQRNALYLTGQSPKYHEWEPFPPYQDKYDHPWWKAHGSDAGHGGTDSLELKLFAEAVRRKTQTPIDVYDSATMSSIIGLSEMSIAQGSVPVACPDFTGGRWQSRKPTFAVVG